MEAFGEIFVVPFFGQGHLFPSMELCKHLSSRNYKTTLILPSHLSSSVPSTLRLNPLVEIAEIPAADSPPPPPPEMAEGPGSGPGPNHNHHQQLGQGIESFLSDRSEHPNNIRPACAVIDVMMSWSKETFAKFGVPSVSFFTSGACSAAMEYAAWKAKAGEMKPGDIRILPGLPKDMALAYSDLERGHRGPPGHMNGGGGPPGPGGLRFGHMNGGGGGPPGPGGFNSPSHPHIDGDSGPPGPGGFKFGPSHQHIDGHGGPPGPGGPQGGKRFGPPHLHIDGHDGPPGPGGPQGGMRSGPPGPGEKPRWLDETEGSIALLINTCDDLEHPFLDYVSNQIKKPVWGVGPLLPDAYWKSAGSVIHDHELRSNRRQSNYTEDEVIQWLDSKPPESVIYISFGSEVGPTLDENAQLANALEKSNQSFIWVIQSGSGKPGPPPGLSADQPGSDAKDKEEGYNPHGLDDKVGDRGLIIRGWAPQLLILSHPSTGGFLSHCGWNSTVEAIGRGVPILAWPIRGDQFHDAKLVVAHLKVGYMVSNGGDGPSKTVVEEDIVQGIEKLMGDEEVRKRAAALRRIFEGGFPASSMAALDAFGGFISSKAN